MFSSTTNAKYERMKQDRRRTNTYYLTLVCFCTAVFVSVLILFVTTLQPSSSTDESADRNADTTTRTSFPLDPQKNPLVERIPPQCFDGDGQPYYWYRRSIQHEYEDKDNSVLKWIVANADVWVGTGEILYGQTVTLDVRTGLIESITKTNIDAWPVTDDQQRTVVINATGRILTPGLIDVHSHVGLHRWPLDARGIQDTNELSNPVLPQMRAIDTFDAQDPAIGYIMREGGVTTTQVLPGSANVMGGRGLIVKLRSDGNSIDAMLPHFTSNHTIGQPYVLKMACGENPKRVYGDGQHNRMPTTRMGSAWLLRQRLQKTQEYVRAQMEWCASSRRLSDQYYDPTDRNGHYPYDLELEALAPLFRMHQQDNVLLNVHCYTVADMYTLLRIAEDEFNVSVRVFHHALEAYQMADVLRERNIGVATFADHGGYKMEALRASVRAPSILRSSGVRTVLKSDHPVLFGGHLIYEASKARHYGLTEQDAFQSVTSDAARILNIDAYVGSVEPAKHADVVLWTGSPMDPRSRVQAVWIDGRRQFEMQESETVRTIAQAYDRVETDELITYIVQSHLDSLNKTEQYVGRELTRNAYFASLSNGQSIARYAINMHTGDNNVRQCASGEWNALHIDDVDDDRDFVVRGVDIIGLDDYDPYANKDDTTNLQTLHRECSVGIRNGLIDCIHCNHSSIYNKSHEQTCWFDSDAGEYTRFSFSPIDNENPYRPIMTVPFVAAAGAHTHLGVQSVRSEPNAQDGISDSGSFQQRARLRTEYGLRLRSKELRSAHAAGISASIVTPQADGKVVGGPSVAVATHATHINVDGALILGNNGAASNRISTLHINVGQWAKRHAGVHGESDRDALADAISGQFTLIIDALEEAERSYDYLEDPENTSNMTAWQLAIGGHIPLSISVDNADDIVSCLNIKARFGIEMILVGCAELHVVASQIRLANVGVVLAPLRCTPSSFESQECVDWRLNVRALVKNKIRFGIAIPDINEVRQLRWHAAFLLSENVPYEQALQSAGAEVARQFRLPAQYRQLKVDAPANFVVYDNDPLSMHSHILLSVHRTHVSCSPQQS